MMFQRRRSKKKNSSSIDDQLLRLLVSPFLAYYVVAFVLNGISIIVSLISHAHQGHARYYSRSYKWANSYYFTNAIFAILHMCAAVYIVYALQNPPPLYDEETARYIIHPDELQEPASARVGAAPPTDKSGDDPLRLAEGKLKEAHDLKKQSSRTWWSKKKKGQSGAIKQSSTLDSEQRTRSASFSEEAPAPKTGGWSIVKQMVLKDRIVHLYILVFILYILWHIFACAGNVYHSRDSGIRFVSTCVSVFIFAGPVSFFGSVMFWNPNE